MHKRQAFDYHRGSVPPSSPVPEGAITWPTLITLRKEVTQGELADGFPGQVVVACDFYVKGIELGDAVPGGYQVGKVVNIDHHAPTDRMRRRISSANLAIERVEAAGVAPADAAVVINHTDCDSVLSSAIVAGRSPPDPRFGDAAIAADHTGDPNPIADMLQTLERVGDFELSLNLRRLLAGERLDPDVQDRYERRIERRRAAAELVQRGEVRRIGRVHLIQPAGELEGEFFPSLLPGATLIVVGTPAEGDGGRWQYKLRLRAAAPECMTLHEITRGVDENYGGRWNAGSNRRGQGSAVPPEAYAAALARRLDETLEGDGSGKHQSRVRP